MRAWPFLLGASVALTALAVGGAVAWFDRDRIQAFDDAMTAWQRPLSDPVAAIAGSTGMSHEGELIFRASLPSVEESDAFNEHCALEGGAVLGCYDQTAIYVYDVTDSRLAGTVEVTAAHEMLHAAYARLSDAERAKVDALVEAYVATIPADDPVFQDMALYPADQLDDEWHSRLGTEFADLGPALEAHYARYFDDRGKVLALEQQSTAAFDALQSQIDALTTQLDAQGPALDARIAAHEAAVSAFNADVDDFNARASNGSFTSQQQFDAERAALVARGDQLDAEATQLQADIDAYNALVAQLTALDADYADLYSALDSSDDTQSVAP